MTVFIIYNKRLFKAFLHLCSWRMKKPSHGKQDGMDVLVTVCFVESLSQLTDTEVNTGRAALLWNNSRDLNSSCIRACRTQLNMFQLYLALHGK